MIEVNDLFRVIDNMSRELSESKTREKKTHSL